MKKMLYTAALLGSLWASAQVGVSVGLTGGNAGPDFGTESAIMTGLAVNYQQNVVDLFTVQGDTGTLALNAQVQSFSHKKFDTVVVPSIGVKLEFPLFVEYGVSHTFNKLKSYFESGINLSDNLSLNARLHNFNPNFAGDFNWVDPRDGSTLKLKRAITFSLKLKL